MFGIKPWVKLKAKKKGKKYYVEINPQSEIIGVDDEKQLRELSNLNVVQESPNALPSLKEGEVCAHWEREVVFLSETNNEEYLKTKNDIITGGYCPDCGKSLGQPKAEWIPKITYKKKSSGV